MSEKLDLTRFEKKMVIRNIEEKDIDKIIDLQKDCFPGMEPWKREHLISHLEHFPEGQFCAEFEGEIIGSCSSLLINFDEYDDRHTWQDITDDGYITNHNPDGLNMYGIEVMVHPKYRRMKIGHRLYEARKDLARRLNLKSIIIGGRIPNYHKYAEEMTAREYVEQVTRHQIYDPVLSFQLMNGFTLMRINPNYLPDDTASIKYATLMEWNNVDYLPQQTKRYYKSAFPVRICVIQYEMKKIYSFEEFANQVEYYVDVASDARSDFAVFPEIFTTQLMSFLEERSPSLAVQRITEYTEDYISLFTDLAVKYNVNIIGGSHFVEEEGKIYNIAYLFRRDGTIEKQYKLHITPNERKWWGISAGDQVRVFDTDCGKSRFKSVMTLNFLSSPGLRRIKAQKSFLRRFVQKTAKAIFVSDTVRRPERLKIKFIRSSPERLETFRKRKIWISNTLSQASSHHLILNSPETALSVKQIQISKWSSSAMLTWKFSEDSAKTVQCAS